MSRVSLVCTVHDELGLANVSELSAILERIQPEVIFLEVPPAAFGDYYENCSQQNLESIAVRRYREDRHVELVAVDLATPENEFFWIHEQLRQRVRAASPEYRQLMRWDDDLLRKDGFSYLNSELCSALWSAVHQEIVNALKRIDDSKLIEHFASWNKTIDSRRKEMMDNIQRYCGSNAFNYGAFLVGAAHRQAIIGISREQSVLNPTCIQWDFTGHVVRQRGA
jgi:hypothetical protein